MKRLWQFTIAAMASSVSAVVLADGLATCDSGPQEEVRRIKIDGGCYEVYALNEKGERVEAYFHPKTLQPVPTKKQ
jgi:hypothetical protein